jgi:transposase
VSGAPGVPDDAAGPRVANTRLRELLGERDAEIAALRSVLAELDELRKQVAELQAQVADLAARLRQNSKNSSRPPSQDGPGKAAPKSLRTKTGRKPGRPEGQPGATMQLSDHPDR